MGQQQPVNLRCCGTAETAKLHTWSDGGAASVTFVWGDGAERTLPYTSAEEALDSLREMGFGGES